MAGLDFAPDRVLDVHWTSKEAPLPTHYVVHEPSHNRIVVCIRGACFTLRRPSRLMSVMRCCVGTLSFHDIVTDLAAASVPFLDGYAHAGIARAAQCLERRLRPRLRDWFEVRVFVALCGKAFMFTDIICVVLVSGRGHNQGGVHGSFARRRTCIATGADVT